MEIYCGEKIYTQEHKKLDKTYQIDCICGSSKIAHSSVYCCKVTNWCRQTGSKLPGFECAFWAFKLENFVGCSCSIRIESLWHFENHNSVCFWTVHCCSCCLVHWMVEVGGVEGRDLIHLMTVQLWHPLREWAFRPFHHPSTWHQWAVQALSHLPGQGPCLQQQRQISAHSYAEKSTLHLR